MHSLHAAEEELPEIPLDYSSKSQPSERAIYSGQTARATNWQNWVFAGGALIAAAIGCALVAINTGSHTTPNSSPSE